jgi:predicted RNA-binding protein YlqC (UPF0109 family)
MNAAEGIQRFLEFIVRSLCRFPDQASIVSEKGADSLHFRITAGDRDTLKIMGRDGRGLSSLRNLCAAAGNTQGLAITIELTREAEALEAKRRFGQQMAQKNRPR